MHFCDTSAALNTNLSYKALYVKFDSKSKNVVETLQNV